MTMSSPSIGGISSMLRFAERSASASASASVCGTPVSQAVAHSPPWLPLDGRRRRGRRREGPLGAGGKIWQSSSTFSTTKLWGEGEKRTAMAAMAAMAWRRRATSLRKSSADDDFLITSSANYYWASSRKKTIMVMAAATSSSGMMDGRDRSAGVDDTGARPSEGATVGIPLFPALVDRARKVARLRELMTTVPGIHQGPACHDAISARLVERAGFDVAFMSGFCVAASRLGLPDCGLISYGEMVEQAFLIASAVSIPVIADGDTGYGNPLNVKRTVRGYMQAGVAGILIEDQVLPKACGHTKAKGVVSREEAVMRVRAAVDARAECDGDIVIFARSDARQAVSFEEALWRVQAFADEGADVVFIDALASVEEMQTFCRDVCPGVPKMANMLEGGGKTPILGLEELEAMGFKIVAYPLSLLAVSVRAMENALHTLKEGEMPPPSSLPSFEEFKDIVGFNKYYAEEERYRTKGSVAQAAVSAAAEASVSDASILSDLSDASVMEVDGLGGEAREAEEETPAAEKDVREGMPVESKESDTAVEVEVVEGIVLAEGDDDGDSRGRQRTKRLPKGGRALRLKITGQNGAVKLETRFPADFIDNVASVIPGVAGVNLKKILDEAPIYGNEAEPGKTIVDIQDNGNRVQVFLE
ncbi:hypothetical protein CBR_g48002 [Chara braunii]|uniref:Isocitrate lyase n=1 Tax=Chara braunii TaxID=69332 RepID=A0A388M229_CHABU|nr:hypothetical protein CBR_g48002 [Chara braunii]|eukprot:GBG88532.1 hypothetical protein CBR_g48002 [Chara braunii]